MKLSELVAAIGILRPYYKNPDGYHVGAEHDILYLFATDLPLSPEDVAKMIECGAFQEEVADDNDEFSAKDYDPEEPWAMFT